MGPHGAGGDKVVGAGFQADGVFGVGGVEREVVRLLGCKGGVGFGVQWGKE